MPIGSAIFLMYWSSSRYELLLVSFTNKPVCLYVGMRGIFQDGGRFGNFQMLMSTLSSYSLITGFADFSFTERCYWYLQSALNPCLKAAPLSVEKPDFPDFLQILFLLSFFLSSFFIKTSYPCPIRASWVSFFTVLQRLGRGCATTGSKEERRHFLLMNFMVVTAVALWFDAI